MDELLRLGDLVGQCIGRITLAHTGLAFRSSSPSRDKGGGEGGVSTRDVEVGSSWQRWRGGEGKGTRAQRHAQSGRDDTCAQRHVQPDRDGSSDGGRPSVCILNAHGHGQCSCAQGTWSTRGRARERAAAAALGAPRAAVGGGAPRRPPAPAPAARAPASAGGRLRPRLELLRPPPGMEQQRQLAPTCR